MSLFPRRQPAPDLSVEEASLLVAMGATLLDVREAGEWVAGHAPDATHVPLGELHTDHPVVDTARRTGAKVVCICRAGGRSEHATNALRAWGVDAQNLVGGMQLWELSGRPVVTDDGGPGSVV